MLKRECGRPYAGTKAKGALRSFFPPEAVELLHEAEEAGGGKRDQYLDFLFRSACIAAAFDTGPVSFEGYLTKRYYEADPKSAEKRRIENILSWTSLHQVWPEVYRYLRIADAKGDKVQIQRLIRDLSQWGDPVIERWADKITGIPGKTVIDEEEIKKKIAELKKETLEAIVMKGVQAFAAMDDAGKLENSLFDTMIANIKNYEENDT